MYSWPGVNGAEDGFSPSRARWEGVRGMSLRSSFGRKRGAKAQAMFKTRKSWKARTTKFGYGSHDLSRPKRWLSR